MRPLDKLIIDIDHVLRVVAGVANSTRPCPAKDAAESQMTDKERVHSAGLMRVNHVGEVCAQALYSAQGRYTNNPELREQFLAAQHEEEDHLAWTANRLRELNSHTSLLNPLWYGGAYALGMAAAKLGDKYSLGFVVETERQVEEHLNSHLNVLSTADIKSQKIVMQMRDDEIEHGAKARELGAMELPVVAKHAMRMMARVMTTLAYRI